MRGLVLPCTAALVAAFLATFWLGPAGAADFRVGTWKTAQTIQPFYYQNFLPDQDTAAVHPFTNPADQKSALLAGSLDMCGTTLAHAIHSPFTSTPPAGCARSVPSCSRPGP